ncbi:FecR domain-containing protein [uncultured Parabacteroides sp.]|uniref:FecR family protein n=1 Tax=uncultured Parabacteroides sp. TaxID=512312 RepID=UPI0025DC913D|nr:FecR domain-containing protein [uncultured Parabacteroides sp.]
MNEEILIRFLTHRCTSEEIKEVDQWIAFDQANVDWLFEMERIWSLKDQLRFSDKQEIEMAYARFMSGLQEKEVKVEISRKRPVSISWMKYAAVIVLIGLLSTNLYFLSQEQPSSMNIVEVPNGQRASLTLSDGTKVWLNSHSKFSYPAQFSSRKRNVSLEGEGFFEVAHNEKAPFVVHANLLQVKVLGTKFNVRVYNEEPSSITLAEGKVEVATNDNEHKVTLRPNEQVIYSKDGGLVVNKIVNASLVKSWTVGEAAYISKQLIDIVVDLERRFNVHITVKDQELNTELFTCRFKETARINQILTLLKNTHKLDYQIQGDHIQIYKPIK